MDLTSCVRQFTFSGGNTQFKLQVNKRQYDLLRAGDGRIIINEKEYQLKALDTNLIGMGEVHFEIDITIDVEETLQSKRQEKLNKLV